VWVRRQPGSVRAKPLEPGCFLEPRLTLIFWLSTRQPFVPLARILHSLLSSVGARKEAHSMRELAPHRKTTCRSGSPLSTWAGCHHRRRRESPSILMRLPQLPSGLGKVILHTSSLGFIERRGSNWRPALVIPVPDERAAGARLPLKLPIGDRRRPALSPAISHSLPPADALEQHPRRCWRSGRSARGTRCRSDRR